MSVLKASAPMPDFTRSRPCIKSCLNPAGWPAALRTCLDEDRTRKPAWAYLEGVGGAGRGGLILANPGKYGGSSEVVAVLGLWRMFLAGMMISAGVWKFVSK